MELNDQNKAIDKFLKNNANKVCPYGVR